MHEARRFSTRDNNVVFHIVVMKNATEDRRRRDGSRRFAHVTVDNRHGDVFREIDVNIDENEIALECRSAFRSRPTTVDDKNSYVVVVPRSLINRWRFFGPSAVSWTECSLATGTNTVLLLPILLLIWIRNETKDLTVLQ